MLPTHGTVKIFGKVIDKEAMSNSERMYDLRKKIGIVFQNPDIQLFSSTVLMMWHLGLSDNEVKKKVYETLEWFGLTHLAEKHPYELSEGEKRRVSIATVMVMDPGVCC